MSGAFVPDFKVVFGSAPLGNEFISSPELLGEGSHGKFTFRMQAGRLASRYQPGSGTRLMLEAEGYATRVVPLASQTNDIELAIEMERGREVEGVVLLPSGQPAVGAEVTFRGQRLGVSMT